MLTLLLVSVGIAHNILLARLATRRAKPAGSFHLVPEAVPALMADLEVGDLPNFGWSTQQKIMDKFGTKRCGDLLEKPKGVLQAVLGNKTGESLFNFIRGIDKRKLESHKERKSVSAEVNASLLRPCGKIFADTLHSMVSDSSRTPKSKSFF